MCGWTKNLPFTFSTSKILLLNIPLSSFGLRIQMVSSGYQVNRYALMHTYIPWSTATHYKWSSSTLCLQFHLAKNSLHGLLEVVSFHPNPFHISIFHLLLYLSYWTVKKNMQIGKNNVKIRFVSHKMICFAQEDIVKQIAIKNLSSWLLTIKSNDFNKIIV